MSAYESQGAHTPCPDKLNKAAGSGRIQKKLLSGLYKMLLVSSHMERT